MVEPERHYFPSATVADYDARWLNANGVLFLLPQQQAARHGECQSQETSCKTLLFHCDAAAVAEAVVAAVAAAPAGVDCSFASFPCQKHNSQKME